MKAFYTQSNLSFHKIILKMERFLRKIYNKDVFREKKNFVNLP